MTTRFACGPRIPALLPFFGSGNEILQEIFTNDTLLVGAFIPPARGDVPAESHVRCQFPETETKSL